MPVPTTAPSTALAISDSARWAVTHTYSYTHVWSSCHSHLLLIVSAPLSISMTYFILLSFCKHQFVLICMSFCRSACLSVSVCPFACLFAVSLPHSQYLIVLSLYIGWSIHFLFNTHSSLLVHVNIFTHLSLPVYQSVAVLHRVLWIWLF